MNTEKQDPDYTHPVAYDAEGRPLYAHPPATIQSAPTQVVHMTRPVEPVKQEVSVSVALKHETSKRRFPQLNLTESEYIISAVRRHPIGLIVPLIVGLLLIVTAVSLVINFDAFIETFQISGPIADASIAAAPILLFALLIALLMYVTYYVYVNNKFFLTNESVIQEIQISLFSRHEQTVSLANIEDASYEQKGIFQQLFDYGSIRLSTQGDETTYHFTYVSQPKKHIATLNNAVEAFKNGRPIADDER